METDIFPPLEFDAVSPATAWQRTPEVLAHRLCAKQD